MTTQWTLRCPYCGNVLLEEDGFRIKLIGLELRGNVVLACSRCGYALPDNLANFIGTILASRLQMYMRRKKSPLPGAIAIFFAWALPGWIYFILSVLFSLYDIFTVLVPSVATGVAIYEAYKHYVENAD